MGTGWREERKLHASVNVEECMRRIAAPGEWGTKQETRVSLLFHPKKVGAERYRKSGILVLSPQAREMSSPFVLLIL